MAEENKYNLKALQLKIAEMKESNQYSNNDILKVKTELTEYLKSIDESNIENNVREYIKNIVQKIQKNYSKRKLMKLSPNVGNNPNEYTEGFAKKIINLCIQLSKISDPTIENVCSCLNKELKGVTNNEGIRAYQISLILHCILPSYIPIFRLNDYDIFDFIYDNDNKNIKKNEKPSISAFTEHVKEIYNYCSVNGLSVGENENENGVDFDLIEYALRALAENNGGVAENESTTEYDVGNAMNEDINIEFDKNMILFGPPGTGKTYNTVIYAVAICDGLIEKDTDNKEIKKVKEILVKHFVGESNITKEEYKKLPASKEILGNHFGGKSNITKGEYEELLARYNTLKDPKKSGRIAFTTFHQSYGYEEFIEGIKPVIGNGQNSADSNANEDAKETNYEADNKSKDVKYEIKSGVFKSFCDVAKKDPDNSYVFIIDEINRGNISKIFGELITLIEPTKRTGEAEAMEAILPYSNESFGVPNNVYIIGTMNTADRSIALMDTALRRRFKFVEMLPDPEVLEGIKINNTIDVKQLLTDINKRIEYLYDREHTIGHAFFTKLNNDSEVSDLGKIFEKSVIPLLQEYFYDDYKKIMLVLGYDPKPNDNNKTNQSPNKQEDKHDQLIIATKLEKSSIFKGDTSDIDIPEYSYEIDKDAFDKIESYTKICNENKNNSKQEKNRLV